MGDSGWVILQAPDDVGRAGWLCFERPARIVRAERLSDVVDALAEVESAVAGGWHAAGFLSYEASPAFDSALMTHRPGPLPLLWFGIYERGRWQTHLPEGESAGYHLSPWEPEVTREGYHRAIARIKEYIAAGDTYQVNYTLRLRAAFAGDPWALFLTLCRTQRTSYRAYVDTGDHAICSVSPELFFRLEGDRITCRPMKGTAPRGLTVSEDDERAAWLGRSAKDRAENVMIVDMIRNDLGRIAVPGTVRVPRLFEVERYDTGLQMTSTVVAETAAPFAEMMGALFPCASITGAPKVRTMQIISELERSPRGIYTGCIGYLAPGRRACFNVAIRTVHVDRAAGRAEYGTGGGIVWDSTAEGEYEECRTKALVLTAERPTFRLLETLLWRPGAGYFLLERHLDRLAASARYFGFPMDRPDVSERLARAADALPPRRHRVRLLLDESGEVAIESVPLAAGPRRRWKIAVARQPVDRDDRYLYHKTTHRAVYERARADFPHHDDVILWNAEGQVTEATIANVVVRRGGALLTPPVSSGLLAGTYRAEMLAQGRIREAVVALEELREAEAVYLINSVRGWIPATVDWGA